MKVALSFADLLASSILPMSNLILPSSISLPSYSSLMAMAKGKGEFWQWSVIVVVDGRRKRKLSGIFGTIRREVLIS